MKARVLSEFKSFWQCQHFRGGSSQQHASASFDTWCECPHFPVPAPFQSPPKACTLTCGYVQWETLTLTRKMLVGWRMNMGRPAEMNTIVGLGGVWGNARVAATGILCRCEGSSGAPWTRWSNGAAVLAGSGLTGSCTWPFLLGPCKW